MAELMKGETWADACKLVRGVPRFQYPIIVEVIKRMNTNTRCVENMLGFRFDVEFAHRSIK